MKTSELIGPALDWAVAKYEGVTPLIAYNSAGEDPQVMDNELVEMGCEGNIQFSPSTDWAQGGALIERERICLVELNNTGIWRAFCGDKQLEGTTPLIAAMRCFIASKIGDEAEIPEELK